MTIEKMKRLARNWAAGMVCSVREEEAQAYHRKMLEMLEREEKYKWHVLRKDPTDLPDAPYDEYYECVHQEHEEDLLYPVYQFDDTTMEFGLWENIFDPVSLGFIDSEFKTIEDMNYTPIVAWRRIKLFQEDSE